VAGEAKSLANDAGCGVDATRDTRGTARRTKLAGLGIDPRPPLRIPVAAGGRTVGESRRGPYQAEKGLGAVGLDKYQKKGRAAQRRREDRRGGRPKHSGCAVGRHGVDRAFEGRRRRSKVRRAETPPAAEPARGGLAVAGAPRVVDAFAGEGKGLAAGDGES